MTSLLFATAAALGVYLVLTPRSPAPENRMLRRLHDRHPGRTLLMVAGLEGVSPSQFIASSVMVGAFSTILTAAVFGLGISSVIVGLVALSVPTMSWRSRISRRRSAAQEAWPRMIDELRVLTGPGGRPIPQALIEVGLRGPVELRGAFEAAQREWALTTDFKRMVTVLKERLTDPTADVVLETLLVAVEVGGGLDARLEALAEDRRADQSDRKDAIAKQSGARFARMFVVIVPAGMALAGLTVGDGSEAYRTPAGQLFVSLGLILVIGCWIWAAAIMRLPEPSRVFDR